MSRVSVIIPAGRRHAPGSKQLPTWLETRPDGALVIESIIGLLDFTNCGRIIVAANAADLATLDCADLERFLKQRAKNLPTDATVTVHGVVKETRNALETVRCALEACNVTGPIFIKDCDGGFAHKIVAGNYVVALKLTSDNRQCVHDLPRMSFAEESDGVLTNVCEKQILSDLVCTGGYGFSDAGAYLRAEQLVEAGVRLDFEAAAIYLSHVVLRMLLNDAVFTVSKVDRFEDWKTPAAWREKAASFRNYVIGLEGVLVRPSANALAARIAAKPFADRFEPIRENIDALHAVLRHTRENRTVIILSSEREADRAGVEAFLKGANVPFDQLVLGVRSVPTTIVSAFDGTRCPYPSADAHSFLAGSGTLATILVQ
jgi:hypothetical protein